jgi:hypothetical protein
MLVNISVVVWVSWLDQGTLAVRMKRTFNSRLDKELLQKEYNGSILEMRYNNKTQNDDVPGSTEDKVDSAVVSPLIKVCLMMAHMWPKHVAN